MVATIGSSGVGKTVYLGMLLDMLSRRPDRMQLLARGAFSVTLQQSTVSSLARCEFPEKTPSEPDRWNWVHCQIKSPKQRKPIELVMPDMAGEALLEEIEHPHSYPVIRAFLQKCSGAVLLIDSTALHDGSRNHDYFVVKLLNYLSELDDHNGQDWSHRPLALNFTKGDECEESFDDPEQFARTHAVGLWQHCQDRFPMHKFFATGVAGACAYRDVFGQGRQRVPLRIEPRGIIEPFEWIVNRIKV